MIQLFDYVKLVFSRNEKAWEDLKNTDKSRNFFMLNRFMSIKYPVQAFFLSHYKIDPTAVSDYWHRTMSNLHGSTPKWIYAKTVKRKDKEKNDKLPSQEMIRWYCEKNEFSRKEFDQLVNFHGASFVKEVMDLEKILKKQGVI